DPRGVDMASGQFQMLSLPGLGEVAISTSGRGCSGEVRHTIRAVGRVSSALTALTPGASLGVRGPYGNAWPLAAARGRRVTVIAGGLGLAPLRGAIAELLADPESYPDAQLLIGARSPRDIPFLSEIAA